MAIKTPIVLGTNVHEPLGAGDTLDPGSLPPASVLTSGGIQGTGVTGNTVRPDFDALPNETNATFQLVAAGGVNPDGTRVTLAQLATALTPLLPAEKFLSAASYTAPNLTLTLNDGSTVVVDLSALVPVTTSSGIQGNGNTGTPIKENFDALPAAAASLPAGTRFVVAADGANNDGSIATPTQVATLLAPSILAETPQTFPTMNSTGIPTPYVGSANGFYLAVPHKMVRWADPASSTGFYAIPVYEVP